MLIRIYFCLNVCLHFSVSGRSKEDDSLTAASTNSSVITVGTVGQYYIDGIFKFLNASKTKALSTEQLSFLLNQLDISPDSNDDKGNVNKTNSPKCFTAKALLELYNLEINRVPVDSFLSICPALIYGQISEECTRQPAKKTESDDDDDEYSSSDREKFGYGTIAVAVISILPLAVFLCIPKKKKKSYPYVVNLLISLAVGTLVSDSFLHLIPQAIGAKHLVTHHEDDDLPTVSSKLWRLVAVIGAIYAMYLFSVLMLIRERVLFKHQKRRYHHRHHHQDTENQRNQNSAPSGDGNGDENHAEREHQHHDHYHKPQYLPGDGALDWAQKVASRDADNSSSSSSSSSFSPSDSESENITEDTQHSEPSSASGNSTEAQSMRRRVSFGVVMNVPSAIAEDSEPTNEQPAFTTPITDASFNIPPSRGRSNSRGRLNSIISITANLPHHLQQVQNATSLKSQEVITEARSFKKDCTPKKHYGWVIILGDLIHNVMDGAAIGAAFAKNPISGLATTVAVACHEIPHEIGDFAALMTSGVAWRGAMTWNILISMTSFAGLYVGLSVAKNDEAARWVYAISAGVFLHHALGEFLPDLMHIDKALWTFLGLQHIGFFVGFGVMVVILIFENSIYNIGK